MSAGIALSDATFDEFVRSSERPVLVDFWGAWCQPCKMLDPILTEMAAGDQRFANAIEGRDAFRAFARRHRGQMFARQHCRQRAFESAQI